jgi:hypothetical protein
MRKHIQYKIKKNAKTQLQIALENHKGNGFAHIISRVPVPMNKKSRIDGATNPFLGILFKVSDSMVNYGFYYANSLDNQAEREGKQIVFERKPRKWGTRIKGTPLVEHTKKDGSYHLYLETKVEKVNSTKYELADGTPVGKGEFAEFLGPKPAPSSTQDGLTKKIILRDYALENILSFKGDGLEIVREANKETVWQEAVAV